MKDSNAKANGCATRAATIPVAHIAAATANVHAREKRNSDTMKGLVESVKANGLIHRIVVRPDAESERFVIVDGHRRFEALKALGWTDIPVEIRDADESTALAVTVAANVQRLENDPILEAEAIEKMLAAGMDRRAIAASIGKDDSYVARRARLTALIKPWREFAKRVPCSTDMLEHVAAYEPALQERVAADVNLDDYELDSDFERVLWAEFSEEFRRAVRVLSEAGFDTSECANCPNNTACHGFLFPEMQNGDAVCQDAACYARKQNAEVDALLERLRRKGTPAVEVASKWNVPEYWNASERQSKKHQQAYVWEDAGMRHVLWSVPKPEEPQKPAMTPEERAARKAEKRRMALVTSARDKVREVIATDGVSLADLFRTEDGERAFGRIAERVLRRELRESWISDAVVDDVMAEYAVGIARNGVLDPDETEAYKELLEGRE